MGKYTGSWVRTQMIPDPERFTRHQPPHGEQVGFSVVELQATAPESELDGGITTDVETDGVPAYPIDRTPSMGGRGRDWTRADSQGGELGVVQRTGYNTEQQRAPFADDACAEVSAAQYMARGVDYGAGVLATKAFEPHGDHGQMFGETRPTTLTTGLATSPLANQGSGYEQLRRGLNSDPLNDGAATGGSGTEPRPTAWRVGEDDGSLWRPARYLRTHTDRRFAPTRQLPTDQVMINPARTPQVIVTAPPPKTPSKGGELFASLARFVPRATPIGGIARTPGPWYEPAEATSEPADISQLPDYSGDFHA